MPFHNRLLHKRPIHMLPIRRCLSAAEPAWLGAPVVTGARGAAAQSCLFGVTDSAYNHGPVCAANRTAALTAKGKSPGKNRLLVAA